MTVLASPDGSRRLYLFGSPSAYGITRAREERRDLPVSWAQRTFQVADLVQHHLQEKVYEFASPTQRDSPRFHGRNYPKMYDEKTTTFDFTVVCESHGTLQEKLLFEYKSAKSSKGVSVDGNAHERLSFQTLQYLEVANMLPNTSFNILVSSAFSKYENKYHVSFNQQSVRLGDAFRHFVMRVAACESEYALFFTMLARFLFSGKDLPRDYRTGGP